MVLKTTFPSVYTPHTIMVRGLKIALPVLATLWIAGVVLAGNNKTQEQGYFRLSPAQNQQLTRDASVLQMVAPRFLGLDENARPFEIQAGSATQANASIENVQLQNLKIKLYTDVATQAVIKAANGHLNGRQNTLGLDGLVQFADEAGHTLLGNGFLIDTLRKKAISAQPIAGQSPLGIIKASGLQVNDAGKTITFSGPASLVVPE